MAQAPLHIAIVDDFPEDREAIRRALRKGLERHFICHEAANGTEALELCQGAQRGDRPKLDILLLDLNLPDLNGLELLHELKGELAILPLPVVVLTGTPREREARAALAAGAQDFIAKSQITPENMSRVVLNAIERYQLVSELHAREALFRGTFEQAAVGIVHTSLDGRWLRVNQRFRDIVGYTDEELLHKDFRTISHPDELERDNQAGAQILQGQVASVALQQRYFHKSGRLVWVRRTLSLIRDAQGTPDYFVSVVEDITALKEAEQALIESEERYHRVVEDQTELICRYGLDLRLTFVNQAFATAVGNTSTALIGQSMLDFVPLGAREKFRAQLSALCTVTPVATIEAPLQLAGGQLCWFQWMVRLIFTAAGAPGEYQGVGHDITERRQAEAAEREQRRLAEALRDSLAALTSSLDVNKVMAQILASAATVVPSDGGSIILIEGNLGRVAYLRGFPPQAEAFFRDYRFPINALLAEALAAKSGAYLVSDVSERTDWMRLPPTDWIRSSIGIPIELYGVVIGLLVLDSAVPHHFQPSDIEKLQAFAHYAGLALENADHVTQLEASVTARTAELRAAKEAGEAILDNSRDGIVLVDPELHIQQSNRAFYQLFGCKGAPCEERSLLDVVHHEEHARLVEVLEAVLYTQSGTELQLRALRQDGSLFAAEFSIGPLRAEGLVCTIRDITERIRSAASLREQRDFLQLIIDNVPDLIIVKDGAGRLQLINEPTAQLYGATAAALIGRMEDDFNRSPAEMLVIQQQDQQALSSGSPLFIPEEAVNQRYFQTTKIPLKNSDGDYDRLLVVASDITERKAAAEALREQRDFLQLVIDSVPALITVKGYDGMLYLINQRLAELYGVTPAEMQGKRDDEIPNVRVPIVIQRDQDQTVITSGEPLFVGEEKIYNRYYQKTKIPLQNTQGVYDRVLMIATEITERKAAEEALQLALQREKELGELKSRFVSMASHEFRTPLTVIRTTADTLLAYRHKLPPEQIDKRLGKIQEQVVYLRDIIEDVLQLTRLQAGRAEFNPVHLDLDALCRVVLDELRSQLEGAYRVQYRCEGDLQATYLDKKMMRQIINNLLSNAIKYSPGDKPVQATLAVRDDVLIFEVSDEGIGIPTADLTHLFEPFHRAANVGNISGTGLGLAITKESVELQRGTLTVSSQEGVGTTFTVQIPLYGKKEETYEQNFSH